MSRFGARIVLANLVTDAEFGDIFTYVPYREIVNASPEIDPDRTGGSCKAIIVKPGMVLGSSWGLNAMHERSTSETTLFFMARGVLTSVQRFDQFTLASSVSHPDMVGRYEVGDGPRPLGFGRYRAVLVELDPSPIPVPPEEEEEPP